MESMEKQNNNRIFYIELLRVISMIAVVVLHTASAKINSIDNW